jgi:hypothetical protein
LSFLACAAAVVALIASAYKPVVSIPAVQSNPYVIDVVVMRIRR